jgi:hypothetical protein
MHMFCLATVLVVVSFLSFLVGMICGFWPDSQGSFSFYSFFTSFSGIAVFIGYVTGLNLLYYCLEKAGIISFRKNGPSRSGAAEDGLRAKSVWGKENE